MATKGLKNKKIGQTITEPMGRESKLTLFMVNMGRDLQATEVMDNRITMTGRKARKMTAITTTTTRIKEVKVGHFQMTRVKKASTQEGKENSITQVVRSTRGNDMEEAHPRRDKVASYCFQVISSEDCSCFKCFCHSSEHQTWKTLYAKEG